jgi:hypothetical protein
MTEQEEDEFMDFGKVDAPIGFALSVLDDIADHSDMTKEEYEAHKERIYEKFYLTVEKGSH